MIQQNGNIGLSSQLAIAAPVTIAALASTPAIIGGGFDLSISPLIVFTNCVYVVWLAPHGLGGAVAVPIVLGVGLLTGLFTGLMITILRVQPVVVTLAMYFALQGVDLLLAPNPVSLGEGHRWIYDLAGSVGPIPGALFTIGAPLLIWVALKYVPFRRLLFAVGSNDATAFSAGVNVTAVRVASYGLGGLFAGIGGLALTALVQSANAANSTQYALPAIAALVLGGTSLAGGRGGLIGVVFGAFSIYLLQNLLANFQVNPAWLQIVYGAVLIAAVVIQGALIPEAGTGGLRPVRMPVLHRSRRRSARGALRSVAAVAPVDGDEAAAQLQQARPGAAGLAGAWQTLVRLQQRIPLIQLLALAAVFAYGAITLPGLDSWISIRSILVLAALVGLASCGQTLLILMGGFDLGVAGFIVAGGFAVTALKVKYGLDFGTALALALIGAAVLGGFAGYICHRFRINPLVVTLAMGSIVLGLVKVQMGAADERLPAAVADQPGGAGDQDLRGGDPAVGRDLGSRDRGVRDLPAPHPHGTQPVRDRGEPARRRPCADQHAPHLDRRLRVQRRHLRARRRADRRVRRHGRRQRRRYLPVPERRRRHRRRHGVRRPRRLHPDVDRRVVPDRARHGPDRAWGEPGSTADRVRRDHPRRCRHLRAGEEAARPRLNGAPTQLSAMRTSQVRHIFKRRRTHAG